ncbi:hypothetical protein B0H14DRAFT_2583562 [Mycena olivaceomarginata]|nr:hypothetical protein B0H14DRAFT_2583562 [Mycena olivaceomarginata]
MKFAITPSESVAQLVARTQYAPQSQSTSAPVHSQSPEDSTASPSPSSDTKDLSLNIDPSLITPKSPTSRSSSNKHATSQIFSFGAPVVPFTCPRRDTTPAVSAMTSSLLPVLNPTRPSPSRSSTPSRTAAVPYPTPNTVTNSSSVPNPRPNDTRLPPLIPKAVTDKLQSQQSRIDELEMTLQRQQDLVESLHGEDDAKSAPKSKVKGTHDNVLNLSEKHSWSQWAFPKQPKSRTQRRYPRVKAGGCYIVDSETGSKLLRPDWDASFNENSRWHQRMLVYTRQQAPLHSPALSAATMAAESDDCILEQLGAVFKNIAGEARKLGEEADDESEAVDSAQISRRKRRKKCDERMAAVAKSGKKLSTSWKFFTQPVYHSTDESDAAVVIDPDTETEAVWRSNAPGVRFGGVFSDVSRQITIARDRKRQWNPKFQHGVLELDALVMKLRNDEQTRNNGKTAAHKRVRGKWKDIPLPFIGASKDDDLKIPRTMIDSEWLRANTDEDVPSKIQPVDGATGDVSDEMVVDETA